MLEAVGGRDGKIDVKASSDKLSIVVHGIWTIETAAKLDEHVRSVGLNCPSSSDVEIDLSAIEKLDTAGAWLIVRLSERLREEGAKISYIGFTKGDQILFEEVQSSKAQLPETDDKWVLIDWLEMTGRAVSDIMTDIVEVTAFLGSVMYGFMRTVWRPNTWRLAALVGQMDRAGLRAVPIIALISFLAGGIIAQQGAFQMRAFGAEVFTVDLVAILICRELGVLLTSIMVAGRTGSSYTAEIGSMKMREEIDAMRVIGLDPIEALVLPRIMALIIVLPLLTFIADMAGILGAMLVMWSYSGVPPQMFIARLEDAVWVSTFVVGMVKAPFMALIIGLIACVEGLRVSGSAESLGQQTTASVVKAIFMVIVVDGIFAMFFAAINY